MSHDKKLGLSVLPNLDEPVLKGAAFAAPFLFVLRLHSISVGPRKSGESLQRAGI